MKKGSGPSARCSVALASSSAATFKEELLCPICYEPFREAVTLRCGHNFCKGCVTRSWEHQHQACPVCKEASSFDDLRVNHTLNNLVEMILKEEGRQRDRAAALCPLHREEAKLFCLEDKELACFICQSSVQHQGHKMRPVQEAAVDFRGPEGVSSPQAKLENMETSLRRKALDFGAVHHSYESISKHNQVEAARLEAQIKKEFEKLHEFLRSEETELLAQLQEETRRKHGLVEGKMKRLAEEKQVLLNEACQLQSDRKEDDYTFLMSHKNRKRRRVPVVRAPSASGCSGRRRCWGSPRPGSTPGCLQAGARARTRSSSVAGLKGRFKTPVVGGFGIGILPARISTLLGIACTAEEPEPVSTGMLLDVAKYLGSLQYNVWKKMLDIITVVPFSFDPNSAAGWVSVSEDLTSITNGGYKQLVANPERFTSSPCVLGSRGFSTGFHTWEVDLGGITNWQVGVARPCGDTHWTFHHDARSGFWYIYRLPGKDDVSCRASNTARSEVALGDLRRIRVELDCDEGEVSFYDAIRKTHIYTFHEDFGGTVFPYFYVGGTPVGTLPKALRICPLRVRIHEDVPD
ncbi:E3 ubiquitin-protein ligase TRIM35 isoform X2 [Opisthocomus hoazin]|uniref:E3 ubiquitin-protein ligase TRIM35 isoform X2 n=1 Tax=Opisthocomus hoazin TaxID=30419 RepID=UPI003F534321